MSLCLQHPRFEVDVRVVADLAVLYRVWLGRETLGEPLIRLDGVPSLVRAGIVVTPLALIARVDRGDHDSAL